MQSHYDRQLTGALGAWALFIPAYILDNRVTYRLLRSIDRLYADIGIPRMGFARLAEDVIRSYKGKKDGDSLTAIDKIASSALGWFPF
jgi:hypothetical protein